MTVRVEFGSKDAADAARADHADHLCVDDDRRLKTVAFSSDTPDDVIERVERQAVQSRAEAGSSANEGMRELSDAEKETLGARDGWSWNSNGFEAMRAKAALIAAGATEWLDHYEAGMEAQAAVDHFEDAKQQGGPTASRRVDAEEDADERAAKMAAKAETSECSHAHDHCQHGDPDACEFLRERCGYDDEEIDEILGSSSLGVDDRGDGASEQRELVEVGDGPDALEVTPQEAGALRQSWQGYKGAIGQLEQLVEQLREEAMHGRQAMAAINAIRANHGQDPLEPERLEGLLDRADDLPDATTLDEFTDHAPDLDVTDAPNLEAEEYPRLRSWAEGDDLEELLPLPETVGAYTKKRSLSPDGPGSGPGMAIYTGNGEVVRVHNVGTKPPDDPAGWWATRNDDVGTSTAKGDRLARSTEGGVSFAEAVEAAIDYMEAESADPARDGASESVEIGGTWKGHPLPEQAAGFELVETNPPRYSRGADTYVRIAYAGSSRNAGFYVVDQRRTARRSHGLEGQGSSEQGLEPAAAFELMKETMIDRTGQEWPAVEDGATQPDLDVTDAPNLDPDQYVRDLDAGDEGRSWTVDEVRRLTGASDDVARFLAEQYDSPHEVVNVDGNLGSMGDDWSDVPGVGESRKAEVREAATRLGRFFQPIQLDPWTRIPEHADEIEPDDQLPDLDVTDAPDLDAEEYPRLRSWAQNGAREWSDEDDNLGPIGVWDYSEGRTTVAGEQRHTHTWKHEQKRLDGGENMVSVGPTSEDPDRWSASVANLDLLERETLAQGRDHDEVLAVAREFVEEHAQGLPTGFWDDAGIKGDQDAPISTGQGRQHGLEGGAVEEQASFDVGDDVRAAQGRERRVEVEENQGGLMADTRADADRGAENSQAETQQQTLAGHAPRDEDQAGLDSIADRHTENPT